jgi:hypothetical protein
MMRHECNVGGLRQGQFLILIFFLISLVAMTAAAEQFAVRYTFERPVISDINIAGNTYQRVVMHGAPNGGFPGQPSLPGKGAYILLPYGSQVENIEIVSGEKILLGRGLMIEPAGNVYPLSADPSIMEVAPPDEEIYSSSEHFPADRFKRTGAYGLRGYDILVLKLSPTEYIPSSGELFYYPELTVKITATAFGKTNTLYRGFEEDRSEIIARVDNPEMLDSYSAAAKNGTRNFDLLILTTPELASAFQPLKDYHDTTGTPTMIYTTADVGLVEPGAIRAFIKEKYLSDGIQYVLLGADDDQIPAQDLFVESSDSEDPYTEYDMPGDIYYACLDGTYNYDNDTYWGEPTDGDEGGDIDLLAEVYVGRVPADNVGEVNNFLNKTFQYLNSQTGYLQDVLMAGEHLRFGGLGEYGGYALDEMIDDYNRHGYETLGVPSSMFNIDKLYDKDWPGNDWPKTVLANKIDNGIHLINHYGHCNEYYAMKMMYSDVVINISNSDLCFIYSQGCRAGHFDNLECWAEYATVKVPHGAFALIMNSRYGWGDRDTDGPSQRYHREFLDAIFNPAENKPELGRANQDSREDNLYRIDEPSMRWCYYQVNLFGDPVLKMRIDPGLQFSCPSGMPSIVPPDSKAAVETVVTGICGGIPVSGSGILHYKISDGTYTEISMTETEPNHYQAALPSLECGESMQYYFSAIESEGGTFYYPDTSNPFQVQVVENTVTLFEDDFETDKGWSISGGLWQRGIPEGLGGTDQQYGVPDPDSGCTGPNVFGYNLSGDYANALTEKYLTSPAIDCKGHQNIHLQFMRWLGIEQPSNDHASIKTSNDNVNWTTIWENGCTVNDNFWAEIDLDISEYAADAQTLYLRWIMGPTDIANRYCGWNLDDVRVVAYDCSIFLCGDANSDGAVNVSDAVSIINYVFVGGDAPDPYEAGDSNCDGSVNVSDAVYIINYVFIGGNIPCDPGGDGIPDC